MMTRIDTDGIAPHERIDFWRGALRDRFGIDSRIDMPSGEVFRQSLVAQSLGAVSINSRCGTPFRSVRGATSGDQAFAVLVARGRCSRQLGRGTEVFQGPRTLCVYPLAQSSAAHYPEATEHCLLAFEGAALSEFCPDWQRHAGLVLDGTSGPSAVLFEFVQSLQRNPQALAPSGREAAARVVLSLVGSALAAVAEGEACESSRLRGYHLQRIRNHVLAHLSDPTLSAASIASAVGLSVRYVHQLFADRPEHLMQWVLEERLRRCHAALADAGSRPIAQIAYAWGFNDAAHFSRVFQKRYGVPPREVRKRAQCGQA